MGDIKSFVRGGGEVGCGGNTDGAAFEGTGPPEGGSMGELRVDRGVGWIETVAGGGERGREEGEGEGRVRIVVVVRPEGVTT